MEKICEVVIDNETCFPGQSLTGRVECIFKTEKKIRSVNISFEGGAHVQFGTKNPITKDEKYVSAFMEITRGGGNVTTCPPGRYTYSFAFELPYKIPSSVCLDHGSIAYWITGTVDLVGEKCIKDKKRVTIAPYLDLNSFNICKNPIVRTEDKRTLMALFKAAAALKIEVRLPQSGYVPSQPLDFVAKVENASNVNVSAVRFKLSQVFKTSAQEYQQQQCRQLGRELELPNSAIGSGTVKTWNVQLAIPSDTPAPDLTGCSIIKMHCEIIGTVVLPFPHRDLKIRVPFYLGTVPLKGSTI